MLGVHFAGSPVGLWWESGRSSSSFRPMGVHWDPLGIHWESSGSPLGVPLELAGSPVGGHLEATGSQLGVNWESTGSPSSAQLIAVNVMGFS